MKRIVADSGSTKTDWVIFDSKGSILKLTTPGINPILQTETEIIATLEATPFASAVTPLSIDEAYFYGAGCATDRERNIIRHILRHFGIAPQTAPTVESDLLGAARALMQQRAGLVAILGTGCNSGYYDGEQMAQNVPTLGYILGDEGSGSFIGKRFLADILKGIYPSELIAAFEKEYPEYTRPEIMNRIYKRPYPNRFLASFAPFIHRLLPESPELQAMVRDAFQQFFKRNILLYNEKPDVSFIGSIAYFYQTYLEEVASENGVTIRKIERTPIEGLARYHKF